MLGGSGTVHEAYLRLIDVTNVDWQHRAHFFAVSATMMRRILLDRARKRGAGKRGGKLPRVDLDDIPDVGSGRSRELIALDDALNALAGVDPRKARVIELRFFGGLSVEETAERLKVSSDTVMRDWRLASWRATQRHDVECHQCIRIRTSHLPRCSSVAGNPTLPSLQASSFPIPDALVRNR